MAISIVTAAAADPVSLTEAKAHLRVAGSDEDTHITNLITAATQFCQQVTRMQFVTATLRLSMDSFADDAYLCHGAIEVPRPPLQSVVSIGYTDTDGASQTWSSSEYSVDTYSRPGRITEAYGYIFPSTQEIPHAVNVTFVAGYGNAAAVPQSIKQAILLVIGHWYENRENVVVGGSVADLPMSARHLLWSECAGIYT